MNKKFGTYTLIWAILLAMFNVIVFVTPNKIAGLVKIDGTFWVGYGLITAAFLGQLLCAFFALRKDDLKKTFYRIPLVTVSYAGLVLMLVAGSLTMAIPNLPAWIGVIVCLLVLGFTAIAVMKANAAATIVETTDRNIQNKTFFLRSLAADAENLIARASSEEAKKACKRVSDAIRYSDPVSCAALEEAENAIKRQFGVLSSTVVEGKTERVCDAADEFLRLLDERNRKCKLLKY